MSEKKKSFWSNITIKRGPEEIISRKTFYFTNGFLAFCCGLIIGLVALILQYTVGQETGSLIAVIVGGCIMALAIAGNIWYLLPLFRSDEALWIKITRPIFGLILFCALLVAGFWAFIALLLLTVGCLAIYIALLCMGNSSSSSSSAPRDYDVLLGDGTKLKQTDFGGHEFKGNDGHTYTQEYGSYHRNDE